MRAKGHFRHPAFFQVGNFDQRPRIVNIRVSHLHTQLDVGCSPSTRPDEEEFLILQPFINPANERADFQACLRIEYPVVALWFPVHDVPNALEHADSYLDADPKSAQALGLLLGTQGARRFDETRLAENRTAGRQEQQLGTIPWSSSSGGGRGLGG